MTSATNADTSGFEQELRRLVPSVIDETIRVTEIPAPTFREGARAEYVRRRFEEIGGWDDLAMDSMSNVVAVRLGEPGRARILACAHLDTVFPDEATPVTKSRGRLTGRGVGDNSLGVASVLGLAQALLHDPEVLFLDEAMTGLDLGARERLVASLADLASDPDSPAVILVTHHVEEIPPGFGHIALLASGSLVAAGPIDQVLSAAALTDTFGSRRSGIARPGFSGLAFGTAAIRGQRTVSEYDVENIDGIADIDGAVIVGIAAYIILGPHRIINGVQKQ